MSDRITEIFNNDGRKEKFTYSLEITPGVKEEELENLNLEPTFFSITWHAYAHGCKDFDIEPLKLAKYLRSKKKNVLLHISCANVKKDYIDKLLVLLKEMGICNLFIILGEKFDSSHSDFEGSKAMITYIRQRTGDYFCIGVAGFPGREGNILQLKEKTDSGADFILTQAFFECDELIQFVTGCKEAGINVPVIPGVFPFETQTELEGFVRLCKVHITEDIIRNLNNQSGIEIVVGLVNQIILRLDIRHFHFFTLNKMSRITTLINLLSK
ncbi:uncharacterized protein LOC112044027 [Bicyclus anynana]|uniref:Uncharacterized protein LOC112044027 n=1 Tax=Bicyclus anynana TaxID=110368 RepID=A0A6J1MM19_BICAN|nr:uncharacterized protein LOC112044027 [Bicyclus anynana]